MIEGRMTAKPALWRSMTEADLPAVSALADLIHPDYPEDDAVFAERLRLYPAGCHVLARDGTLQGYVVSHPWMDLDPPALNSLLGTLPVTASTFYIHDLALLSRARGSGAASAIVTHLVGRARAERLPNLSLVAVNGSAPFWRRQGFEAVRDRAVMDKLRGYGEDAQFMMRAVLSAREG
jgi:ribosomal protein S18 acetylase RimI-like enzyme